MASIRDIADLTVPEAVAGFFDSVGPVDVLVNCAGGVVGQVHQPLETLSVEDWRAVVGRQPDLGVPVHPGGGGVDEVRRLGADRQHLLRRGAQRQPHRHPGLRELQGGPDRLYPPDGARARPPRGSPSTASRPGFVLSNPTSIAQFESYGPEGQAALLQRIALRRLGQPRGHRPPGCAGLPPPGPRG